MCGITGFLSFNKSEEYVKSEILKDMTDAIKHRGPDDNGIFILDKDNHENLFKSEDNVCGVIGKLGFGHRRLSILDLSEHGHQPMYDFSKNVYLTYNGEIYNYLEIRSELEQLGIKFHSTTDTEVLLNSYLVWGKECFKKFNGMWALAIYDKRNNTLLLSRDRYGKKPLFYYKDDNFIVFSSEIKSLFCDERVPKNINKNKIVSYAARHYRYVDIDEETYFEKVYQIPKSSFVIIKDDGSCKQQRYWNLENNLYDHAGKTEKDIKDEFQALFHNAVKIRLRSDVPVGTMLSGGMDSTSITAIAARENKNTTAFSAVTGDGYYDESEYIKAVVEKSGVNSEFIYPQPDSLFDTLKEMYNFHDQPIITVTWYSLYLIAKKISEFSIPVILTGHGGDELLGGYWDHYHYNFADLRDSGENDQSEREVWLSNHNRDPLEYGREKEYITNLSLNKKVEIEKYSKYLTTINPDFLSSAEEINLSSPFKKNLNRRLYLELFYETVPPVLRTEDRNMMAFSIENRVPFLDYRLAEFCFSLPNKYKIRNGLGKWLLRNTTHDILPEKVYNRKDKTGHNAPADIWWRHDNRKEIENLLSENSYINNEIYNKKELQNIFERHLSGENHYMFIWQYINLNLWYKHFFGEAWK